MSQIQLPEVFTLDEVARATGTPRERLEAFAASGELRFIQGTTFISADEALRMGRRLRQMPLGDAAPRTELFDQKTGGSPYPPAGPAFASSLLHAGVLAAVLLTSVNPASPVAAETPREETRLVFLATPGPGGGGGGGGSRSRAPAPRLRRTAPAPRPAPSVQATSPSPVLTSARREEASKPTPAPAIARPAAREPEPAPAADVVAPVAETAADSRDRAGEIAVSRGDADGRGSGTGTGAGSGQGSGSGDGLGAGIGAGSGGGTGGGPYRPGSGIEPPRLLREVKAEYTDEARRRGVSGDVLLEIVVRRDGTVGDIRVLQGLGAGLDARAVQAVRQWRFAPALRRGEPVDVLVEVAVEFTLR